MEDPTSDKQKQVHTSGTSAPSIDISSDSSEGDVSVEDTY